MLRDTREQAEDPDRRMTAGDTGNMQVHSGADARATRSLSKHRCTQLYLFLRGTHLGQGFIS